MRSSSGPKQRKSMIDRAVLLAGRAHAGQHRKDGRTPYIVHPVGVLRVLSTELGVTDPVILSGAVLHDVLEDTTVSRKDLVRAFGEPVAQLVEELTLGPEFHGPAVPDAEKTRELVSSMARAGWNAVLVKLADRYDNLKDMANAGWGPVKQRSYRTQTLALLEAIRSRWRRSPPPRRTARTLRAAMRRVRAELGTG